MIGNSWHLIGYFAALCVFATFCMRSIVALRILALISNLAFIVYGEPLSLWPIVGLHLALIPVNVWRLYELRRRKVDLSRALRHKHVNLDDDFHSISHWPKDARRAGQVLERCRYAGMVGCAAASGLPRHGAKATFAEPAVSDLFLQRSARGARIWGLACVIVALLLVWLG